MTDNTVLNQGTGGDTIATDDIGGIKYQRVKVCHGSDGTASDTSHNNPMPVEIHYADSPTIDSFGRLRMSNPVTLFDSKQIEEIDTVDWTNKIVNTSGNVSIGFNSNQASVSLTVGTSSGDRAVRQTRRKMNYQPGKSLLVFCTGVLGTGVANNSKRIGYFDDNNGLFFQQTGSGVSIVKRSKATGSVVDTTVPQASWNVDPLDGTGPSGVTLDPTKTQIFVIDFEWLGVGRVRYGFVFGGVIVVCHEEDHANVETTVYMSSPNLPVRYEIVNTGVTAGTTSLTQICSTVISEGGHNPNGLSYSADRGITATGSIGTTLTPVISIRLKSTRMSTSITRFGFSILAAGNSTYRWALILNPTVTGGSGASWVSASNAVEKEVSRTGSVSGGTTIASGYADGNIANQMIDQIDSINVLGGDVDGVQDELMLAVQTTSTSDPFYGSITWRENS